MLKVCNELKTGCSTGLIDDLLESDKGDQFPESDTEKSSVLVYVALKWLDP